MGIRIGPVHMNDGNGLCTACGTTWPSECALEKNAVWFAEVSTAE